MSQFEKGDTVQLKSGGPIMTIEHIGSFGGGMASRPAFDGVACVWFDGGDTPKRDEFPCEALKRVRG